MLAAIRSGLLRGVTVSSRFRKREDGAAAVEFALVALPFFALMFAVIELSIFFFASRYLEDQVFNVSRRILTGQINGPGSCATFKSRLESAMQEAYLRGTPVITFTKLNSYTGSPPPEDFNSPSCQTGGPGQRVLVEVSYNYPFAAFRVFSGNSNISELPLRAATAFTIE
jgi:Flp pilus assembly protein TadG